LGKAKCNNLLNEKTTDYFGGFFVWILLSAGMQLRNSAIARFDRGLTFLHYFGESSSPWRVRTFDLQNMLI